jgi:hypothetical protein
MEVAMQTSHTSAQRSIGATKGIRMARAKLAKIAKLKDQIDSGVWVVGPLHTWRACVFDSTMASKFA